METEEKVIFGRRLTVWKHVSDSLLLFISFVFRDIAPADGDTSVSLGTNQILKTVALDLSRLPDLQPSKILSERVHIIAFTFKGAFQIIRDAYWQSQSKRTPDFW